MQRNARLVRPYTQSINFLLEYTYLSLYTLYLYIRPSSTCDAMRSMRESSESVSGR